jgi:hypothetical protein
MIDRTVAHLNIEHYRKLLHADLDEAKRHTILQLLAEEEKKLERLKNGCQAKQSRPDG